MVFPETIAQIQLNAKCTKDYAQRYEDICRLYLEIISRFTESVAMINKRYKVPCPYGTYLEGSIDAFSVNVECSCQDGLPEFCMQATINLLKPLIAPTKGFNYTCRGTTMPIPGFSDMIMAKLEEIYDSVCGEVHPKQTPAEGA